MNPKNKLKATGRKRSKEERERDLPIIARMYAQGQTIRSICEYIAMDRDYTLSPGAIFADLELIRSRWLDESVDAINRRKADELSKIDEIERQAWDAWEKSQQVRKKRKKEIGEKNGKVVDVDTTEDAEQVGDVKFLEVIGACVDRRCKILGLDAAKKLEVSGEVRTSLDVANMPAEDVLSLNAILNRAKKEEKVIDLPAGDGPQGILESGDGPVTEISSDQPPENVQ